MHEADRRAIESDAAGTPPPGKPSFLKRAARKAAQLVYRAALPVIRPLAFRTRRYLTQNIQDELNRTQFLIQGVKDELQRIRAELTHDIRNTQAMLTHDIRHTHAMQLDALHKTTASVQHEVLVNAQHWHDAGFRDAQKLSFGLHQSIQASRESVREEVLRSHDAVTRGLQVGVGIVREAMQSATEAYVSNMSSRLDRIEQLSNASARHVAVHSDHDAILVKSEVGYVLCADSDHAVLAGLLETGELERGTRLLIQRFLEPDDIFVDVGAHLGLLSLAAARAMRGKGQIFAFEPFLRSRSMLERSFWINGFADMIEVHGAAVSDHIGETKLFLGATSGHHSIFALDLPNGYPAEQVDVPLVTLDSALPSGQIVNLLKIDAEGAELNIIEGAASLISNNPHMALIVELGASHLKRAGHSLDRWFAVFAELGLIYLAINPDTGLLENVPVEQLAVADTTNLFFARPDSLAWKKLDLKA